MGSGGEDTIVGLMGMHLFCLCLPHSPSCMLCVQSINHHERDDVSMNGGNERGACSLKDFSVFQVKYEM